MEDANKSNNSVLYGEIGKYSLDISKLVFGGIILAGIMKLDINRVLLFVLGGTVVLLLAIAGFAFIILSNRKKAIDYGTYHLFIILRINRPHRRDLGYSSNTQRRPCFAMPIKLDKGK